MSTKVIPNDDATVTVHASIFGSTTVDVVCEGKQALSLTLDQFAAIIYPSIKTWAAEKT